MVVPQWNERDGYDDLFNVGQEMIDFKKSAGIWYSLGEGKRRFWDRRLVLWMRADKGKYLEFYDTNGNLVTYKGKRLQEAAVCTLEVVLRNMANYSIGFLLQPIYKKHEVECISDASSWMVIGYFPFPDCPEFSTVSRVKGCVTDEKRIMKILQDNPSSRKNKTKDTKTSDKNNFTYDEIRTETESSYNPDDDSIPESNAMKPEQDYPVMSVENAVDDDDEDDEPRTTMDVVTCDSQTLSSFNDFDCGSCMLDSFVKPESFVDNRDSEMNTDFEMDHFYSVSSPSLCHPEQNSQMCDIPFGSREDTFFPLSDSAAAASASPLMTFGSVYDSCLTGTPFTWPYDKCFLTSLGSPSFERGK